MSGLFSAFLADENGATAIEYALICLLISTAIIAAINNLSVSLLGVFNLINQAFTN